MAIAALEKTVIFDYGDVISLPQSAAEIELIGSLVDADPAIFWPSYNRHRAELDRGGLSIREYWQAIAADCGIELSPERIQELWTIDMRGWLSANPDVVRIILDLDESGTRVSLLSNAGPDFGGYFRHGVLSEVFDDIVVSGEVDLIKPDPRIYELALERLGITAEQAIFVDNKVENVDAAIALGITGHVFVGADELRSFLEAEAARERA